jgi:hypothetical protein
MHTLTRIVTFESHPRLDPSPQLMLYEADRGNTVITLKGKRRFFVIRKVKYDDSLSPLFSIPGYDEKWYESLDELRKENPTVDTVVLNNQNYLKEWK